MRDKILDSINNDSRVGFELILLLIVFVCGMIVGSVLHDSMFHAVEQSIEKARQSDERR